MGGNEAEASKKRDKHGSADRAAPLTEASQTVSIQTAHHHNLQLQQEEEGKKGRREKQLAANSFCLPIHILHFTSQELLILEALPEVLFPRESWAEANG